MNNVRLLAALGAALAFLAPASHAQGRLVRYDVTPIQFPSQLSDVEVIAINDLGQIAGTHQPAGGGRAAFVWTPGGALHDLNAVANGPTDVLDLNDLGQLLGRTTPAGQSSRNYIYDTITRRYAELSGLNPVIPTLFLGRALNDLGEVIGNQVPQADPVVKLSPLFQSQYSSLAAPNGATITSVADMNVAGMAIGDVTMSGSTRQAYVFTANGPTPIVIPGALESYCKSVNDQGQVLVSWRTCTLSAGNPQCWEDGLWENGRITQLPPARHYFQLGAHVNNLGQVAGTQRLNWIWTAILHQRGENVRVEGLLDDRDVDSVGSWILSSDNGTLILADCRYAGTPGRYLLATPAGVGLALHLDPYRRDAQDRRIIQSGTTFDLTVQGGEPGSPFATFVLDANGQLFTTPIDQGVFAANGKRTRSFAIPSWMQGRTLRVVTYAGDSVFGLVRSPERVVRFD